MSHMFAIVLSVLLGSAASDYTVAAPSYPTGQCPLRIWRGGCRRLDEAEKERVRAAVIAHVTHARVQCARASEAILGLLENERSELWTYNAHTGDRPLTGTYVLAQAAYAANASATPGIGFRYPVLTWPSPELARIVAHEAAHLMGGDEAVARDVETTCVIAGTPRFLP
jgi:hypothetical protein